MTGTTRTPTVVRTLSALLAALLALLAVPAPSADGRAVSVPGRDGPAPTTLRLIERTPWVEPDGELRLAVGIDGAPPGAVVRVVVREPLRGRYELTPSITGTRGGRVVLEVLTGSVDELAPDGNLRLTIPVGSAATPEGGLRLDRAAVLPVEIEVDHPDGDEPTVLVTHLVRVPTELEHPLGVALMVDLGTPPALRPDGTRTLDADGRARLTVVADLLERHPAAPVSAVLTPETLDALDASDAPLDRALLERLREISESGTLLPVWSPWVRVDAARLDASGLDSLVDELAARGASRIRSLLGVAVDGATIVFGEPPTPDDLAAASRHGATRVVVPADSLPPLDPNRFVVALVQPFALVGGDVLLTGLAPDPELQTRLDGIGDDPVLTAHHVLADLAALVLDRPAYPRGTVITLPDPGSSPRLLDELLAGLASAPLLAPGSVADVVAGAELAAAGGTDARADDEGGPLLRAPLPGPPARPLPRLADQRALGMLTLDAAASVFPAWDELDDLRDRVTVAASADLDDTDRDRFAVAVSDEIESIVGGLAIEDGRTITLAARDGTLPLLLRNDTGRPATVVLRFSSEKLTFPAGDRIELLLEEPATTIEIPVRARASGAFPLELTLESPDGVLELGRARHTVRSTAVSGLGIVLGALAAAVLAGWWVRTARRARRARTSTLRASNADG